LERRSGCEVHYRSTAVPVSGKGTRTFGLQPVQTMPSHIVIDASTGNGVPVLVSNALYQYRHTLSSYNGRKSGGSMFGFLKKRVSADQLAKSLARYATGHEACAMMAGMLHDRTVDDEVAASEFAFLRASYLRSLIAEYCKGATLQRMHEIVDREVVDAFSGKEITASREIITYYQNQRMADVAKARLASYREAGDALDRTVPMFCVRLGARNVMTGAEVRAILDDMLGMALRKSLKSVRPV
jgi:hypothetical protein